VHVELSRDLARATGRRRPPGVLLGVVRGVAEGGLGWGNQVEDRRSSASHARLLRGPSCLEDAASEVHGGGHDGKHAVDHHEMHHGT
jgi:hypothetical protein